MVHVEPDERDELVGEIRGERGHRHQHDPRDGITYRGEVRVDRCGDLGDRDEEHHDEHELGADQRDDEHRPLPDPPARGIPRGTREGERREHDRDQQERFPDEEGEPHDRGGGDREAGHEDGDDRSDAGCGDVDPDKPCGEEGDLVAHRLGGFPGGLHNPDAQLIDDFQQQCRECDDHERPEDGLRQPERGSGEGGGVAADQAGDELEAEEDQHHEDRDAEQQVVDGDVAGLGDIHQGRGVEDRPDRLEQPPGGGTHRLGEPVERGRDQRRGSFADGIADRGDHGNVAHAHHGHQLSTTGGVRPAGRRSRRS
ncbi:hypothetical protein LEUCIP111803_00506 [Leucobacter soli]|uniref:Uncharacterized protein n=1 Tax=Leucobacter soli TaxID=2812850 RepID=A0A916JTY4_9MICO|nr:hypothetical protein LEUCIP111803_00506 [Leucobacter soli]